MEASAALQWAMERTCWSGSESLHMGSAGGTCRVVMLRVVSSSELAIGDALTVDRARLINKANSKFVKG